MQQLWANLGSSSIFMLGSVIAIISFIFQKYNFHDFLMHEREYTKSKVLSFIVTVIKVYKFQFGVIILTAFLMFVFYGIGSVKTSSSSTPTPLPTFHTATASNTILVSPNSEATYLDELDSILPKRRAFFVREWNNFDLIKVKGVDCTHSIGVCIPKEDQEKYYEENLADEQMHSENIEYLLSYKYQTFQFDYGIDATSYPEDIETESNCYYMIVVQSCNSKEFLRNTDNVLYISDWTNYRSSVQSSVPMDVSSCEAIRITVYWKFNVRQDRPLAFNIAIVDPVLYTTTN